MSQVAAELGMRRDTVLRWRREDVEFGEMLEQAESQAVDAVIAEGVRQTMQDIKDLAPRAREVLDKALGHADPRIQLQAAGMVMKYAAPSESGVNVNVGLEARLANVNTGRGD